MQSDFFQIFDFLGAFFELKIFEIFFFTLYKILIYIWFCIFTISSSYTLHPWPSNCLVYELFAIEISKNNLKHCLNIKCQLFMGQMLSLGND